MTTPSIYGLGARIVLESRVLAHGCRTDGLLRQDKRPVVALQGFHVIAQVLRFEHLIDQHKAADDVTNRGLLWA